MTRLDWEKARQRETRRAAPTSTGGDRRQAAMTEYVWRHELSCFKCGLDVGPWAKTGRSRRGPWVICAACVQEKP